MRPASRKRAPNVFSPLRPWGEAMELLLVRHAVAHDKDAKRWPDDDLRPLTAQGKKRFQRAAKGVSDATDPPSRVFSSGLVRADETAKILNETAKWPAFRVASQLRPDAKMAIVVPWLATLPARSTIALVGHEPHLHELTGILLGGVGAKPRVEFKKGAIVALRFEGTAQPGGALLRWALTPRLLRRL